MRIKSVFVYLLFCFNCIQGNGQDQRVADSLKLVIIEIEGTDTLYLNVLYELAYYETNAAQKLEYANELIKISNSKGYTKTAIQGYIAAGLAHLRKANFENALSSFFAGLEIAVKENSIKHIGQLQSSIADTYTQSGNMTSAFIYYEKALESLAATDDSVSIATLYSNYGDALFNDNRLADAQLNFEKSLSSFEELNHEEGTAFALGNLGMVFAEQDKHSMAEDHLGRAIGMFEERKNFYPISIFLTYIADIYLDKNNKSEALKYALQSLDISSRYNLKNETSAAHQKLAEINDHFGNSETAYTHYKQHIALRDSINNIETVEALANQRTEFEVSQEQAKREIVENKQRVQKAYSIAGAIGVGLLSLLSMLLFRSNRFKNKTNKIIAKQKARSDELLLNILPKETADELKEHGRVAAKKYDSVSVLFADFVGFTSYSKDLEPEIVVKTIDKYFRAFDEIVDGLGLEKIKTVGDGYICAGGLPVVSDDHAIRLVQAAREMKNYVDACYNGPSETASFDIRIGIHSGPVVSGVVGSKKFAYDIWGDTVNTAARLESHSEAGKINISKETFKLIEGKFACTPRKARQVKGIGIMEMYFVEEYNSKVGTMSAASSVGI